MEPELTNSAASVPVMPGGHLLESIDRGVVGVDVVADLRLGHGLPHGRAMAG